MSIIKDDGTVIHFKNPKVQAAIGANTFCISGAAENKRVQEMLPDILNQLGPENMNILQNVMKDYGGAMSGAGASQTTGDADGDDDEDDEDVPELVAGDFEAAASK